MECPSQKILLYPFFLQARVNRDLEDEIFQSIDPARLRTNYTEYVSQ